MGENHQVDGVDLIPFLTARNGNDGRPHETLYWRMGDRKALRHGDWKIVQPRAGDIRDAWELYNLADDPSEERDLAADQPETLMDLRGRWDHLSAQMAEPRF